MHVGDGQLSGPVLVAGATLAGLGVARSVITIREETIPSVAVISSLFFAVSTWHLPLPGGSLHLVLCGLMGLLVGRHTFLAASIVLTLQALLFGHGGITSLGINTLAMALPGPLLAKLLAPLWNQPNTKYDFGGGFLLGAGSVLVACLLLALAYAASDLEYLSYLPIFFLAHGPLMLVEGMLTASILVYLKRARPALVGIRAHQGELTRDA